ncbi:MAG: thiamine pyrophosphate-requiring protein [Chromatiales bacterium]|jgi:acetolactate synthase I/II/III large subunit|nr:thiamine pyrophosphate-requiring protein [Chromatiales bacterium]
MSSLPRTVAQAYLMALKSRGVDWIFGNAGTDFAPIIEAIAATQEEGAEIPAAVEIIHETVAVAMAHGYYLMTGRAQCVMVHVNVGVANGLMGVMNACRANVPIMFASGRTPITESGRLGSRNAPIHWGQEMFDQGGLVREFVKWDHELRAGEQIVDLVDRSLAISQSEPKAPIYLSLPREVLAEQLPNDFVYSASSTQAVASPPYPDPAAIVRAVAVLAKAKHPLLITSDGSKELFDVLGAFAERFAIPVVQFWRMAPAISTHSPMYAGESPRNLLAEADAVVVLDTIVPWMPGSMAIADDAVVIQIGSDPHFSGLPVRSFRSDIVITATPATAIAALHRGLDDESLAETPATTVRRTSLERKLRARRTQELSGADGENATREGPMSPEFLSRTLSNAVGNDATIVNELGLATSMLDLTQHNSFFGPPTSAGLGWGGGAALGVKLAEPERLVVWATGDGSYVFSNPAACHHAAASLGLGLLTIVADNRVWNAVRRATIAVYPQGVAARTQTMPLTSLEPAPDYTKFVEAYGGYGETVTRAEDLAPALNRAIEITKTGRQALLAVHCSYPDRLNQ